MKTNCLVVFLVCILSMIGQSSFGQVNLNQGLIAYYPFSGNANDATGNGNNGILQNGVALAPDRFGNANSAYSFDGVDDYIRVPNSSTINPTSALSIALYFKPQQSTVQTLIGKISYAGGIGTQFQVGLGFSSYPGAFFGLNPPTTGCSTQISVNNSYVSTGTFLLNQWNCLVNTFENGVQKIYLNGVLIQSATASFSSLNLCSNSDIQIGSWWSFDPQRFKGSIDDIRIYNRALNASEVSALCMNTACANWLSLPSATSYANVGDLDVAGTTITVEATINRTAPWTGSADVWQGDVVSKHLDPTDCNYLLRPSSAEITTSNGYFKTPVICPIELNKTYHLAMTYDGTTLKFYRNGYLMSQTPATGTLFQNNYSTRIGLIWSNVVQENFLGYINEVRIWNIARTQSQIQSTMNQSLVNPTTIPGLLAYYTFDNLLNKQGNATWNATLGGTAAITATNPDCNFVADSCNVLVTPPVVASFTAPDTVCINAPVTVTNTSTNASTYYWSFCQANLNQAPTAFNLGNPGGFLSTPVFCDIAQYNGNYYGFVVNHNPGGLVRLDFGNSLLNTPAAVFLGNPGNAMNTNWGNEGIQVVNDNGNWYAIIVGGNPANGSTPRVVRISFGTNLTNPTPTGTNWGNLGNMLEPIDLHVFQDNGIWYGFTVNAVNNTITRFNFTNTFANTPTAVNLGNIGGLNYPDGIFVTKDGANWRAFITNGAASASLTRLDFGTSLLNTPTGVNLGNLGGSLVTPRDITIMNYCGQSIGFVVNGNNDLIRLNFSTLSSNPTVTNIGNPGGVLSFPHSLSKLFRVGSDLYSFVTNASNNNLVRVRFSGCTNSSIPSSTLQNPPPVSYNTPGIYNINLSVDEGLSTQSSYCKQVVVLANPAVGPLNDTTICPGGSANLLANITGASTISWTPSTGLSNPNISNPIATPAATTQYIVTATNAAGCSVSDTVVVGVFTPQQCAQITVTPGFTAPDTVCVGSPVTLTNTSINASSYYWNFCVASLSTTPNAVNIGNPGNSLAQPVFMDYAFYNGNYYGFLVNYSPGALIRLDFGNSLLNTPTTINLGNFGGIIPPSTGIEGIQVVNNEGKWYAIIVGGATPVGITPRIIKVEFGTNLANTSPVATNWGNPGGMTQPIDLHMFKENGNWYGLTVNVTDNTITRINFTNSFNNTPTTLNLGNIGNLAYPTGIYAINDNGFWRVFITNGGNGTRTSGVFSLSRLDFGSSLLNVPTGVNLGNPGNVLQHPRDFTIMRMCGQIVGFAVNGHLNNSDLVKLDFNNNLSSVPVGSTFGNIGNFNFPHSISKIFRENNDLYGFVTNVANNTISRIKFDGCTNASISGSPLQTPPPVTYNTPGIYNINLSVDDGLPTQGGFCKQVVVVGGPPPVNIYNADTAIYAGASIALNHSALTGTYSWSPAAGLSCTTCSNPIASPTVSTKYYLTVTNNCGTSVDSIQINVTNQSPSVCNGFQMTVANSIYDRGYDVVALPNNEFMLAGVTGTAGNDDILVTKMSLNGTILWSKRFGGNGAESVRKMSRASDGGVLITGQTKSFGSAQGEILAFKVSNSGNLVWSRKFGVSSASGDLGMDIIETNDGGYAISGILNKNGGVADAIVIKLDPSANISWNRKFDSNDGDDGIGLVQKGDTLIVSFDLQNSLANYSVGLTKLLASNGNILYSKKVSPASRGLFNPYLFRNPAQQGYIISGHTIDGSSYANMNHTIVVMDDNFDIITTKLINSPVPTNDSYTGFVPLADGSFIGAATSQISPDGYVYRIAANNSVMFSKRFNVAGDRRLYRLAALGHEIIGIGGTVVNSQEKMFVTNFFADGTMGAACNIDTPAISIQTPAYTSVPYTWLISNSVNFTNTVINLTSTSLTATTSDLCQKPLFTPFPDTTVCLGNSVQLTTTTIGGTTYTWSPATGLSDPNIGNPVATPGTTTQYIVTAGNNGGCTSNDTLLVNVTPPLTHSPTQTFAICNGGSVKIGSSIHPGTYLWSNGLLTDSITVSTPGTFWVETRQNGCMVRDSFTITPAPNSSNIDFAYQQNMCTPKTVQFTTALPNALSFTWNFGNSQTSNTSLQPSVTYTNYGNYTIKLVAQLPGGCLDTVEKAILVGNAFDNALVINSDTTICLGDSVLLKTNGPIFNYCWQASTGLNPTSLNAFVKPLVPTTYVLTSQVLGTNLVISPGFTSGNNGFTSDYTYVTPNAIEGQYWVGTNPSTWNNAMSSCGDHTSGSGNMMVVNGSPADGAIVWTQTIAVTPNTNYQLSTWLTSLVAANPANLQFSINNKKLGNAITGSSNTCQWNQFSTTWNSGNNTSAVISIINNNIVASGNDYAIDDLFFGTVTTKTDSFKVGMTGLCDTIKLTGPDKICSPTDTLTYSIYKSANCNQQFSLLIDNTFADIITQSPTSVKLVFKKNGTTSIKVSFSNSCKIVADSIPVTVKFSPANINFGPDISGCRDTAVLLNAHTGFVSYQWQDGSSDSTFQANTPGTYFILAQNLCGVQFKDTLRIIKFVSTPFRVSPLNATVCTGDSVLFTASGGSSYQWQPSMNFGNPLGASTKAIITTSQNYTCFISDANCGRDTLVTIPVVASSSANISVTKTNDVSCGTDTAVLKATGGVTYVWSPIVNVVRLGNEQVTVNPTKNTMYYVSGTDAFGCKGKDSILVAFINSGDQQLYMPNAFSPNGDGLNEVFRPRFIGPAKKYQFSVFNRWGQLIFRSTTPGEGWDGKFKGKDQPQDVFVYYVTAEGGCNGKFEQKGTFVLIR